MTRFLLALALALTTSSPALAQDMPLSQILIDGEGWKKAEGKSEKPKPAGRAMAYSPDGGTVFEQWVRDEPFLRAAPVVEGGGGPTPARYAPLRTRRGERAITVTDLVTDRDGRIYAATPLGIQVFDPTGRLCGVMTAPEGQVEGMTFEGDKLTLWVGDTKYERKLRTQGTK
jgi:hypothetical protein